MASDNFFYPNTTMETATVLNRPENFIPLPEVPFGKVMITGGAGSIGKALSSLLRDEGLANVYSSDVLAEGAIGFLDVRDEAELLSKFSLFRPRVVFHLAGAKHAPLGERDPLGVCRTNITGTMNVLKAAALVGARVVVASTCKSCDPETAYGASKLVAERMTLNAAQAVVRYHNVIESSGNVFELWREQEIDAPIGFTSCRRYFISMEEAVRLTVWAAQQPSGRYVVDPGHGREMSEIARALYPTRKIHLIPTRRGDRVEEPLWARSEKGKSVHLKGSIFKVTSPHDYKEEV